MFEEELESIEMLSEHIQVLSNLTRLRILKFIEKHPKDIRAISREIKTSYENTQKHLKKLMGIGVIQRVVGQGPPTSKRVRLIWKYTSIPGGINSILEDLMDNMAVHLLGEQEQEVTEYV